MDFMHEIMAKKCRELIEKKEKEMQFLKEDRTYLIKDINQFTGISVIPVNAK